MKKLVLFVLLLVLVLQLAGTAAAQCPIWKTVKVGFSWHDRLGPLNQAWQDYMEEYSEEYAERTGVKIDWVFTVADGDPARESANIQDMINQKMDIIVAWARDSETIGASIEAAQEAGIPFVTFDHESTSVQPVAHVGADSYHQARTTAEEFAKILADAGVEGKCIELLGDLGDVNALNRSKGWHDVEDASGQWETIAQMPTEWKPEKFKTGTANALAAHPEANCIFAASDFAFSAIQSALEEVDRWAPRGEENHVWVAAQDVTPPGYEALRDGYLDVSTTYDAYFHAVELVNVLGRIAMGDYMQPFYLVPGRVATPDNIETMDYIWAKDPKYMQ